MQSFTTKIFTQANNGRPQLKTLDFIDCALEWGYEKTLYYLLYDRVPNDKELIEFNERGYQIRKMTLEPLGKEHQKLFASPLPALQSLTASFGVYYDDWDYFNQCLMSYATLLKPELLVMVNIESQLQWLISEPSYPVDYLPYFVTLMNLCVDDGLTAPAIAARAVTAARAPANAALSAAIGALSGMEEGKQLDTILPWLNTFEFGNVHQKLKAVIKEDLIPGFSRKDTSNDPKISLLRNIATRLADKQEQYGTFFKLALHIEDLLAQSGFYPNAAYHTALSLYFLSVTPRYFSLFYTFCRFGGLMAHINEERNSI